MKFANQEYHNRYSRCPQNIVYWGGHTKLYSGNTPGWLMELQGVPAIEPRSVAYKARTILIVLSLQRKSINYLGFETVHTFGET